MYIKLSVMDQYQQSIRVSLHLLLISSQLDDILSDAFWSNIIISTNKSQCLLPAVSPLQHHLVLVPLTQYKLEDMAGTPIKVTAVLTASIKPFLYLKLWKFS